METIDAILLGIIIVLMIAMVLFILEFYGIISFGIFPESWLYVKGKVEDRLNDSSSSSVPANGNTLPSNTSPNNTPVDTTPEPTPATTDQVVVPPPPAKPRFIGCFGDHPWKAGRADRRTNVNEWNHTLADRALPLFGGEPRTVAQCNEEAKKRGSKYFGLQDVQGAQATAAQCFLSSATRPYDIDGSAPGCQVMPDGNTAGKGWTNAIYEAV